jgi:hypothetical protein
MPKGWLDKKQRCADQRHKRALAAGGLSQGPRKPLPAIPVASAAPRMFVGRATVMSEPLPTAHCPVKRAALGKRQAPGDASA